MQTPSPEINQKHCAAIFGGRWQRVYASRKSEGQFVYVFQNRDARNDLRVLRNDVENKGLQSVRVPDIGSITYHSCIDDPAFATFGRILANYQAVEILRYRPGKRITVAAVDSSCGPVIIKFVARGIETIYARVCEIARASADFGFKVGRPIAAFSRQKYFVQERLSGVPIDEGLGNLDGRLVRRMATAARSLHDSTACLSASFSTDAQHVRSARYAKLIRSRLPVLRDPIDELLDALEGLGCEVRRNIYRQAPIHGSLHSHQWLIDGNDLALVDFDRAAMGHAELDIATFVAELDYEHPAIGLPAKHAFIGEFPACDIPTLNFYRVHKHLAKVFKASKIPDRGLALKKSRRNLGRAQGLLKNPERLWP